MSRHPLVKWAQRSDEVFITVELPDAKDVKLKLEPEGKFAFTGTKDGTRYEVDFELYDKIKVEDSKHSIGMRSIVYAIHKEEEKWWSRLLKQEGKPPVFLKVDWDKWVDEDNENDKRFNFDDMDFSKLDMGGDEDFDDMEEAKDDDKEEGEDGTEGSEKEGAEKAAGEEAKADNYKVEQVDQETKA